jgi:hypothetical protein
MRRTTSRAAERVIAAAAAAGAVVTARQLERWRQDGWIDAPVRRHLGRRGSSADYPPETVAQVIALASAARRRYPMHRAILDLFAEGRPVGERALHQAYDELFTGLARGLSSEAAREDLEPAVGMAPDPFDVAEAVSPKLAAYARRSRTGRRWSARVPKGGASRNEVLQSVFTNLALVMLTGEGSSEEGIDEVLQIGGVSPSDDAAPHPVLLDRILNGLTLERLRERARDASLDELVRARDEWRLLVDHSALLVSVRARIGGLEAFPGAPAVAEMHPDTTSLAGGAVGMLLLREAFGARLDAILDDRRRHLPWLRATAILLDDLPREAHPFMESGGVARLMQEPAERRERILTAVRSAVARHPEEAAVVRALPAP